MKTPEIATELLKHMPSFKAPARFIVFKRWDALNESDEPDVVIFFACPDAFQVSSHWQILKKQNLTVFSLCGLRGVAQSSRIPFLRKTRST